MWTLQLTAWGKGREEWRDTGEERAKEMERRRKRQMERGFVFWMWSSELARGALVRLQEAHDGWVTLGSLDELLQ